MTNASDSSHPPTSFVKRYRPRPDAPGDFVSPWTAAHANAPASAPPHPPANAPLQPSRSPAPRPSGNRRLKHKPLNEDKCRRRLAVVAVLISVVLLICAFLSVTLHRSVLPIPFGSHLLVDLAVSHFHGAWPLVALNNVLLAGACLGLAIASTVGHTEIPGDPRLDSTWMWRRTARFAVREALLGVALFVLGITLHAKEWLLLAALCEGAVTVYVIEVIALLWIPAWRTTVTIELDLLHQGMMNRITIGPGRHWRRGALVIYHDQLLSVTSFASPLEACFGLRSLRIVYRTDDGQIMVVILRALGHADLVIHGAGFLNGKFRSARGRVTVARGFAVEGFGNHPVAPAAPF